MTTVVAFNIAREPAAAQVLAHGGLTWTARKLPPAEDDHAALSVSVALAGDGELIGVTLGQGDPSWALARGASQVVRISDVLVGDDDAATAAALAAAVRQVVDANLVVIGDSEHHPGIAPVLAAHLGWPLVLGVSGAATRDERVEVTRHRGAIDETISIALPAVIAVVAEAEESQPPGMKAMLAARKRPVQEVTAADLELTAGPPLEPVRTRLPEVTTARLMGGDAHQAAAELVKALRAEGVL